MKNYFLKLFNYDQFANNIILKAIVEAGEPAQTVKLMAHLLAAQQIWLERCKGLSSTVIVLWPDWKAGAFEQLIDDNHAAWIALIDSLNEESFNKVVTYKNSRGDLFDRKLEDILAHLINHGTHHRAQIGQALKSAGLQNLPLTDYIYYIS